MLDPIRDDFAPFPASRRLVFLCSGGGGNLRFVHRALMRGLVPDLSIVGVMADRECDALAYAASQGIPHALVRYRRTDNAELKRVLAGWRPDLIATTVNRILDPEIVALYRGRLINLHYSLLPAFQGLIGAEPVRQALALGCKFVGTTVHHVEDEVDAGRIIDQAVVPVTTDDVDAVLDQVFRSGCLNLLNVLAGHGLPPGVRPPAFGPETFDEAFWRALR